MLYITAAEAANLASRTLSDENVALSTCLYLVKLCAAQQLRTLTIPHTISEDAINDVIGNLTDLGFTTSHDSSHLTISW